MQRNLTIGLVLLLVAAGAFVFWQLGRGDTPPVGPGARPEASAAAPAADAQRADAGEQPHGGKGAAAAGVAPDERVAVAAAAPGADGAAPFVTGQVVGTDGRPIAGAKVVAAPSLAFTNANGDMDPASFDAADFEEADMFDPTAVIDLAKKGLAERTEAVTDSDGRFRIQPRGTSRGVGLRVLARGFAILDRRVDRPAGADADAGVLTLQRGAVVAGRVVDGAGNAVAGAFVRRVPVAEAHVTDTMLGGIEIEMPGQSDIEALRDGETSQSDAAGRFELAHVTAGELTLRARHADHPAAKATGLVAPAGSELRDVIITMQRGTEIRGRISGVPDDVKGLQIMAARKPDTEASPMGGMGAFFGGDMAEMLADAGMPFGERRANVEPDGSFVLHGLSQATYRLWPTQPGKGLAGNTACGPRVEATAGSFGVELRYEPGVAVTFVVIDAATKAPIERLWVRDVLRGGDGFADMMAMAPNTARAQHYPGGAVTVANVRPKGKQTLQLTVDAVGYGTFEKKDIVLPKVGSLDLGAIALESAPVVRIAVVAADDGRPVPGATVRLAEKGDTAGPAMMRIAGERFGGSGPRSTKTGPDGRCTLNALRVEKGVVEVDSPRFAPFVGDEITFAASGPTEYVARLSTGGRVDVTVVGPDDKPLKDTIVEQKAPSGATAQKKTDALGVAAFERLAPGAHGFRLGENEGPMAFAFRVSVNGEDPAESGWQNVDVADKTNATLRLAKKQVVALRGIVRENGAPLEGARVSFADGEGSAAASEQEAAMEMVGEMMAGMGGGKRSTKSGVDGEYTLADLPEGSHRLRVTHKSRAMTTVVAINLRNGDNVVDVDLETTTVRGVVLDTAGKPLAGARVRVKRAKVQASGELDEAEQVMDGVFGGLGMGDAGGSAKTDDAGAFELRGVDPDVALQISATAKGFSPASANATLARGATSSVIELKLGPAGRVKVTAAADAMFAVVVARFIGEGAKVPPVTQMLRKGKGTLDGLKPGTWELECHVGQGQDQPSPKRTIEVIAGQTIEVAL